MLIHLNETSLIMNRNGTSKQWKPNIVNLKQPSAERGRWQNPKKSIEKNGGRKRTLDEVHGDELAVMIEQSSCQNYDNEIEMINGSDNEDEDNEKQEKMLEEWRGYGALRKEKFSNQYDENVEYHKLVAELMRNHPHRMAEFRSILTRIEEEPKTNIQTINEKVGTLLNHLYFAPQNDPLKMLFKGVVIYVNGYTYPTASTLQLLMQLTGGEFTWSFDSRRTTHTIANVLSMAQKKQERARLTTVRPEWILDSLENGKLMNIHDYKVLKPKNDIKKMFAQIFLKQAEKKKFEEEFQDNNKVEQKETKFNHSTELMLDNLSDSSSANRLSPLFVDKELEELFAPHKLNVKISTTTKNNDIENVKIVSPSHNPDLNKLFSNCQTIENDEQQCSINSSPNLNDLFTEDKISKVTELENNSNDHSSELSDLFKNSPKKQQSDIITSTPKIDDSTVSLVESEGISKIGENRTFTNLQVIGARNLKKMLPNPPEDSHFIPVESYIPSSLTNIDEEMLSELPDDIRREITGYIRQKSANTKNSEMILSSASTSTSSKNNKKTNLNRKTKANNKAIVTNQISSQLQIDKYLQNNKTPEEKALILFSGKLDYKLGPNLCGKANVESINEILTEWILTEPDLLDMDISYIMRFMSMMIDGKKFDQLNDLLWRIKWLILERESVAKLEVSSWKTLFFETFASFLQSESDFVDHISPQLFWYARGN